MKLRLLTIATILMASTAVAQAAWTSDDIARKYSQEGYTRVEIDISATLAKVEAIKGTEKLEVIYDLSTGAVLKTERELVDGDDDTAPGVFVRDRDNRWFGDDDVGGKDDDGRDDDDQWDDSDGRGDDRHDDDDDDRHDSDDDDHSDDHGGRDHDEDDDDDRHDREDDDDRDDHGDRDDDDDRDDD